MGSCGMNTELVYFGILKKIKEKNGVNIEKHVGKILHIKIKKLWEKMKWKVSVRKTNVETTWPLSLSRSLIEFSRIGLCVLQQRTDIN
jgi:hypothetical protein